MGRHPDRITLAKQFCATDVVGERGQEAVERVRALTGGVGVHSVLECVGTEQSIPSISPMFYRNITICGGSAPVRTYIDELLPDVLEGRVQPGKVFDRVVGLDGVPNGYAAMNERKSIKVMIQP